MKIENLIEVQPRVSHQWTFKTDDDRSVYVCFEAILDMGMFGLFKLMLGKRHVNPQYMIYDTNNNIVANLTVDPYCFCDKSIDFNKLSISEAWKVIEPFIKEFDFNKFLDCKINND